MCKIVFTGWSNLRSDINKEWSLRLISMTDGLLTVQCYWTIPQEYEVMVLFTRSFSSICEIIYREGYIYKWKATSDCSYSKYIKVINTHMYCFPWCSPEGTVLLKDLRKT